MNFKNLFLLCSLFSYVHYLFHLYLSFKKNGGAESKEQKIVYRYIDLNIDFDLIDKFLRNF